MTGKKGSTGNPLLDAFHVNVNGVKNILRLRTQYTFNERTSAEVGADLMLQGQQLLPAAVLNYEVHARGRHLGAVRLHNRGVAFRKAVTLSRGKFSCKPVANVGANFGSSLPELGIDVAAIKPNWVLAAGAVLALALNKPITGSKRWPEGLTVSLPLTSVTPACMGEAHATLQRTNKGFMLKLNQLNGIVRM